MGMGFTASESRIALRACHKDPNTAISYLLKKREESERLRAEEKAKHQQKKFGKTVNGKHVDMAVYKSIRHCKKKNSLHLCLTLLTGILDMGFDSRMIVAGLRQTDNDGPATIALLTQNPDLLQQVHTGLGLLC